MRYNYFFYYIQIINQQNLKYYYLMLCDYHFAYISCIYLLYSFKMQEAESRN